jgi:Flp pilus assembly pilin Flp
MKSVRSFSFSPSSSPTRRRSIGQGMTEYLIIVALIAVAAIGTFAFFGKTIRDQVGGLAQEVSGHHNHGAGQAATDAGKAYNDSKKATQGLSDYNTGNIDSEK